MMERGFDGFPAGGIIFLQELLENNSRPWFAQNRARYKEALEAPAKLFLNEMEQELMRCFGGAFTGKIFRLHRDLRFSKDKTPYNSHLRMAFFPDGHARAGQGFYFSLEPEGFVLGGGAMGFSPSGLERFRHQLLDQTQGPAIDSLVSGLVQNGYRLEPSELKRVPAGFDKDHPRAALLRRKSLTLWRDFTGHQGLIGRGAVGFCMKVFQELHPLLRLLNAP